jgi:hypothetical protein
MGGGLLQLICYGAQDIYLTNNPQITFFKIVYRRHTNFSIQTFEKNFDDHPDFGKYASQKLFRLGDLAMGMHLRVVINQIKSDHRARFAWVRRLGYAMIESVEVNIGGCTIDKQYGTWLDIWWELTQTGHHKRGHRHMIGDVPSLTEFNNQEKPQYTLYIPLQFWFNRYPGLALPLIAIQYHDIYINVRFEENRKLIVRNKYFDNFKDVKILEVGLVTDYVYLDYEERKKFAIVGHEYLIEQVQLDTETISNHKNKILLTFNYPTKEIIWVLRHGNYISGLPFLCYTHRDDWSEEIVQCSKKVLLESMILLEENEKCYKEGFWEVFKPCHNEVVSLDCNLEVINRSNLTLWINTKSLLISKYNLIKQIKANIMVHRDNRISINIIEPLSKEDISIPVIEMQDTRVKKDGDVYVYQFNNYGILITGDRNPLKYGALEYNAQHRVDKRNAKFFGVLQPYIHHSSTPKDGINLYSFANKPELLQPTGTSNFSTVENIILDLEFKKFDFAEDKDFFHHHFSKLSVFAFSYNVFRVISGLTGVVYNG